MLYKIRRWSIFMHVVIALFTIYSVWRWADWKNWYKYHSTMLFIMAGGLLYEYLTKDFHLWVFHPDFLYNHRITVIVYAVITMPLSVLLFLSSYPTTTKLKELVYLFKWVFIYSIVELALQIFGRISYDNGWTFWHSVMFDVMMFPMLRLHHIKPLRAYLLSLIIIVVLMWYFKVPLN
ncbi:CBO0543 family protein [Paenibacillus sp. Soil766]|uniref:CBO0543 family protein n=1 Tax=Paenibacillus sp. Soil766 TaxID=1736404 RepID=UPI002AA2A870|nr:CBO0543 family protein [Paenibacillus sp. Soil766]